MLPYVPVQISPVEYLCEFIRTNVTKFGSGKVRVEYEEGTLERFNRLHFMENERTDTFIQFDGPKFEGPKYKDENWEEEEEE